MTTNNKVAVIVPIYKDSFTDLEEYSFYRNLNVLKDRDVYLIGPKRLANYLWALVKKFSNVNFKLFGNEFFGKSYRNSRLMMSREFYESFSDYSHVLICHLDVIVFEDRLDYWMQSKYDNIGAPLFKNIFDNSLVTKEGCNGGFCLRKVDSCRKVLSKINFRYSRLRILWKMEVC